MKSQYIKVLIKVPRKWVDFDSPTGMIGYTTKQLFERMLTKKIEEKVLNEMKLPEIKITAEEVKDRMLSIMAHRALDKNHEEE